MPMRQWVLSPYSAVRCFISGGGGFAAVALNRAFPPNEYYRPGAVGGGRKKRTLKVKVKRLAVDKSA